MDKDVLLIGRSFPTHTSRYFWVSVEPSPRLMEQMSSITQSLWAQQRPMSFGNSDPLFRATATSMIEDDAVAVDLAS